MTLAPAGPGIRHDSGVYEGWNVPIDYDPLLAKLIGYGSDREQAIARLERALDEYFVGGIKTNISLFQRILRDADFRAGQLDTGYLDRLLAKENTIATDGRPEPEIAAVAAALFAVLAPVASSARDGNSQTAPAVVSNWKQKGRSEALR